MIIVVNDASILIDLLKTDLSDEFFRPPFDMHTKASWLMGFSGYLIILFQQGKFRWRTPKQS